MTSAFITHPSFLEHDTGPGHPERIDRLKTILSRLRQPDFADLQEFEAERANLDQLCYVHPQRYVNETLRTAPRKGHAHIDGDTVMSPQSGEAALYAAGALCQAVDLVMDRKVKNVFCAVRPPGHHAEPNKAMGFCFFNNIAIAAWHARKAHGLGRVAVVDFDVHHGNGTQAAFWNEPDMYLISTHQSPLYPGTGSPDEYGAGGNIKNILLPAMSGSDQFRQVIEERVVPSLARIKPDFLFLSAGFDAHHLDPLAQLQLTDDDYAWVTQQMTRAAAEFCDGRLVSALEGGYDLTALENSVGAHMHALMAA